MPLELSNVSFSGWGAGELSAKLRNSQYRQQKMRSIKRECKMVAGGQGQVTLFTNETMEAVRELVPEAGGHCWVSETKSSQRVNKKRINGTRRELKSRGQMCVFCSPPPRRASPVQNSV